MKIFFLHGLESNHQSSKVDLMRTLGYEVHAEYMDYKNVLNLYVMTLTRIFEFKPDMIVGSSMGGYFAFHLGTHYKTNLLLLNPALPNRSFDPPILPDGKENSKIWALIGKNDDIVDPLANESILKSAGAVVAIGDHEHRTPLKIFESFFKEVVQALSNPYKS
jgi:hypothetical protein